MGQVVARLSRSRRRRNLAGAVNSMKYVTRLAEFEVHMAGTARYLVLRARLYRWIRRLGALRGSWMVDDATWRWGRVARREALATWRMTTSRALVASADGRRMLLRPKRHSFGGSPLALALPSGSAVAMAGAAQEHWEHMLPLDPGAAPRRVSLTFRSIVPGFEDGRPPAQP